MAKEIKTLEYGEAHSQSNGKDIWQIVGIRRNAEGKKIYDCVKIEEEKKPDVKNK